MGGGLSGMDAIHAGVAEELRRRDEAWDASVRRIEERQQLEREAGSYAVQGALEAIVQAFWPDHPLYIEQLHGKIQAAGIDTWRRTNSWKATAITGRNFPMPPYDYAKRFTADIEQKLFQSQFYRGEAEKKVVALEAKAASQQALIESQQEEIARLNAQLARLVEEKEEARPRILKLRSDLAGSERDLARHMTIEHAFRARLEQLDPFSALVSNADVRTRLGDHGYKVFQATGDWLQVKEVGRSFVDYQYGAGSADASDSVILPADMQLSNDVDVDGAEAQALGDAESAVGPAAEHASTDAVGEAGR
jgi:hypothetical protein